MSEHAAAEDGLPMGSVIDGRYRIDGVLGSGGMGRVYRGEHTGIGRAVAIKVLHASMGGNREAVTRFQREALASGRLDHPNIVAVSDFGELPDGAAFLVMEALDGEPLGARLERGRLPWREAIAVMRGLLAGLAHAHERGVVHRDVKPDNVFLAMKDGELLVKVLDFGIAKLIEGTADDPAATRQGMTIGTPAYLSPEQAVGGEITPATDVYSATVVLFEMLTGRPPFQGSDPLQMLGAHAAGVPPTLREVAPDIELPDGIEELVQRGLSKRAAMRMGSALDYLAELDAIVPLPARRDSRPVLAQRQSRPIAAVATPVPTAFDATERAELPATEPAVATDAPAALGAAPTLSLTPLPQAARAVTLGDVISQPLPRSWIRIAGAIMGGAVLLGIGAAIFGGGHAPSAPVAVVDAAAPAVASKPVAAAAAKSAPRPHEEPPSPPPPVAPAGKPVDAAVKPTKEHEAQLKAALHQLADARTCGDRRAAIAPLVTLGDASAIGALKAARVKTRWGENVNACLTADADAAIKKLTPPP